MYTTWFVVVAVAALVYRSRTAVRWGVGPVVSDFFPSAAAADVFKHSKTVGDRKWD